MPKPPSWRNLEAALLHILSDYGFAITETRGEAYVALRQGNSPAVDYRVEDFAKELEKELER